MTLKPRRTRHRNRVGWTSIKTSRGWGLHQINSDSVLSMFGKKRFVLGIVAIAVIIGGIGLAQGPLFHSYERSSSPGPGPGGTFDPTTVLWQVTSGQASTDFKTAGNLANFGTTAFDGCSGCKDIALTASSTVATEALTNSSINSLSQAVSKDLLFSFNFYLNGNPTLNIPFYYFLTLNSTIPASQTTYNPLNDPNVVFAMQVSCSATCTTPGARSFSYTTYVQHRPGDSINSEIPGGVCTTTSSCFINAQSFGLLDPTNDIILMQQYLNYTGGTTKPASCGAFVDIPPNSGCSRIAIVDVTGNGGAATTIATAANSIQPQLLSQPNYYFGIFASPNLGSQLVTLYDTGTYSSSGHICDNPANNPINTPCNVQSMEAGIVLLVSSAPVAPPPTIDTGGFFGPIIRVLITIGVFIAQNIIGFFAYLAGILIPVVSAVVAQLANGVKLALNAIGNFFGWGALGDNLFTFTNGVVSAVVQVLLAIGSYLSDIVNRVINFLSIVSSISGQIFGANGFLAAFFTLASNSFTQLVGIFAKFVLIGTPAITVYDFILYFQLTGDAGFEGFGAWWGFNRWLAFSFINLTVMIINKAVTAITDLLSYIPTIAAHMPEDGLPALPTLQNIPFPGLRIPTGHVQKFREGDPAAVALWVFGGGLFMSLLALNVPGVNPLANIIAGSGCNPISCFNTAYTQVFLPFTLVFVVIIGAVFITEMIHGVTMGGEQPRIVVNVPKFTIPAEAKGRPFRFGTKKFATLQKGSAKKAAKRKEQLSPEQRYENRYGGLPGE